jgi:hypothetical protein
MMWLVRLALNRPYTFIDAVIENPSDAITDGALISVQQPKAQ